ncbi:hypothetical protein [Sphingobium sp. SYK-6]|uniref:hypothetical protein n=1 Tax=Sphingobium sp. (strain NBRC 103272 / SYK-6) TaxID=627192 RepID=UPI0011D24E96|nr:hypothetical protein [Sphingobium sp. SYK-6]
MTEIIAIAGVIVSTIAAAISIFSVARVRREVRALESTLASKAGELPPSPDEEDPHGRDIAAQISDDDQGDR